MWRQFQLQQAPGAGWAWGVVLGWGIPMSESLEEEGKVYAQFLEPRESISCITDGPERLLDLPCTFLRGGEVCGMSPVKIQIQTTQGERTGPLCWGHGLKLAPSALKVMEQRRAVLLQLCVLHQEAACLHYYSDTSWNLCIIGAFASTTVGVLSAQKKLLWFLPSVYADWCAVPLCSWKLKKLGQAQMWCKLFSIWLTQSYLKAEDQFLLWLLLQKKPPNFLKLNREMLQGKLE